MKRKRFQYLRKVMKMNDFIQGDLAKALHISQTCLSNRFNGNTDFPDREKWAIMDLFHEPPENLHLMFPRNGGV